MHTGRAAAMKSAIVVFPGSNREQDARAALRQATGRDPAMVCHRDTELPDVDLILIPGGFSYGDYLRCGAMAAHSPIMREVKARAQKGVPVLGICNGFQVLTEAGILPGALRTHRPCSPAATRPARRSACRSRMARATTPPILACSTASKAKAALRSA